MNAVALDEATETLYITETGPIPISLATKQVMLSDKSGSIIKFDLKTRKATTLLSELAFPNGIVYDKKTNSIYFS